MQWLIQVAAVTATRGWVAATARFGEPQFLDVATSIYMHAAAAVPALFPDLELPCVVRIWSADMPEQKFHYQVRGNEFGRFICEHVTAARETDG